MTRPMAVMLLALPVGFCQHQQAAAPPSNYCKIAKPIYWSAQDTRLTKEAVDQHNKVWKRLCRT